MTLELLAETPLASLTTRQIAERLDISQPALFRHFRTREHLLVAVMRHVRVQLGAMADEVLRDSEDPLARLRALARALLAYADRNPGLPRLLFSPAKDGPLRTALREQVSMQASIVAELVRDGKRRGMLRANLDTASAATCFVGMIQGLILRAQLFDEVEPLAEEVESVLSLWLDGARALPCASAGDDTRRAVAANPRGDSGRVPVTTAAFDLLSLDVRPILAEGTDPLDAILDALATVVEGGVLTVTVPFRPLPLITLLRERKHGVFDRQVTDSLWSVDVVVNGGTQIVDLTDLEPPDPLEHVLKAASRLGPGAVYLARLPRSPRLLIPHLRERNVLFAIANAEDGAALLRLEGRG